MGSTLGKTNKFLSVLSVFENLLTIQLHSKIKNCVIYCSFKNETLIHKAKEIISVDDGGQKDKM